MPLLLPTTPQGTHTPPISCSLRPEKQQVVGQIKCVRDTAQKLDWCRNEDFLEAAACHGEEEEGEEGKSICEEVRNRVFEGDRMPEGACLCPVREVVAERGAGKRAIEKREND